ncbi:MAG: hypothetical protein ACE5K0_02720 [Candidatus Methanofastidiosia archaeon]
MYDLHLHLMGHGFKFSRKLLTSYLLKAEILNLEALGFVDHFPKVHRKYKKMRAELFEASNHVEFPIYYGCEINYPFSEKIPRHFDYVMVHIQRGVDLSDALFGLRGKRVDLIAHPCQFGSTCRNLDEALDLALENGLALELNLKRFDSTPKELYSKASKKGISLILGSDAHSPEEMIYDSLLLEKLEFTKFENIEFLD